MICCVVFSFCLLRRGDERNPGNRPEQPTALPTALGLPVDHRLAPTARAGTSLWTTLDKDYGLLLLRSRRGCGDPGRRNRRRICRCPFSFCLLRRGAMGAPCGQLLDKLSRSSSWISRDCPCLCGVPGAAHSLSHSPGAAASPQPCTQPYGCRLPTALPTPRRAWTSPWTTLVQGLWTALEKPMDGSFPGAFFGGLGAEFREAG